uniref:GCN5-related N-acetyltransferase n=1 Tax=uncultured microorganism TaxID=358574 RepID=K0J3D1_9ZZZZ|nr:GCN5-related N-acetyltransferase [uncultured microorganism]
MFVDMELYRSLIYTSLANNNMITCRRAVSEDAQLFRSIRLMALKDSPDAFGSTHESALERDLVSWRVQLDSTVSGGLRNTQFAFSDGECVGIAALYREDGSTHGDIIMMWVSPQHRGSQAASLLVTRLLDWACDEDFKTVYLNVTDSNDRAVHFYKKCGFVSIGERVEVDVSRGLYGIRMTKNLA